MVSQRKKFDRWSTTVPATTQCLIQLVRDEVVPQITQYGFDWIADYAEGKAGQVGANVIPLQIRAGDAWPTVEIFFSPKGRPWFRIQFGWVCDGFKRHDESVLTRQQATLTDAPIRYILAKDQGAVSSLFTQFGYNWWVPFPRKKLTSEVNYANRVLSCAIEMLREPMPPAPKGASDGYISKNIYMSVNPAFHGRH